MTEPDATPDSPPAGARRPPDVQALVDATLAALDERQESWAEAVRQDAVESVGRIPTLRKIRHGVRVPVHDMFVVPLARAVERLTRQFVEEAALPVAAWLGCPTAELVLAGQGCIEELDVPAEETDHHSRRGWTEPELDYRLRFERELQAHVEEVYRTRVRRHLGRQLESVSRAWAVFAQARR